MRRLPQEGRYLFSYPSIARASRKSESSTYRLRFREPASLWSISPTREIGTLDYIQVLFAGTARTIGPQLLVNRHSIHDRLRNIQFRQVVTPHFQPGFAAESIVTRQDGPLDPNKYIAHL